MRLRFMVANLCCWLPIVAAPSCGGEPGATPVTTSGALAGAATTITSGPLAIASIAAARPVLTTDERRHLVFELLIQNIGTTAVQITGIDIADPARRHANIASYRDGALAAILAGADPANGGVAAGAVAAAFFDVALAADRRLPQRLATKILIDRDGSAARLQGPTVAVIDDGARPLGPPLRGANLFDLNGCCAGAHTRALLPVDGRVFLAQRYAIDFLRLTEEGSFSGDPTRNESYFLFGAEVIAATSGRIVEVVDGIPENVPTQPLPPFEIATAAGNHVVEALDDGRFALYAHLQPGSVRVQPGVRVRRGQVIGLVGNTGNSTEPHLHFHVTDGPSALGSNGIPYVFDRFDLIATIDLTVADPEVVFVPPPQERRHRLPMNGDVLAFP
jgi:hypothetical protein